MGKRVSTGRGRSAAGFTLIELTVVLLVLVALAGMLVPILTGYVQRSHAAASSTNIGEINKFVQLYQVKYLRGWGSRFDALLNGVNGTAVYGGVPADFSGSGALTVAALTTAQAQSLNDAGITELADMQTFTATLNATTQANPDPATFTAVLPGTPPNVVFLSDAHVREQLGLSTEETAREDYVLFGLGTRNTLIGKVMSEAPLHFDEADPAQVYSRFLLVFAVPESSGTGENFKARFVGAVGVEGDGLGEHLKTYYSRDAQ